MDDDSRTTRWERRAEAPLAVASALLLTSYAIRVLAHGLPEPWRAVCLAVTLGTWTVSALDHSVRRRLSGRGPAS